MVTALADVKKDVGKGIGRRDVWFGDKMEEGHTLTFTVGAVIITFIAFIGLLR